eukprot:11634841-Heterocapsa_arctica.AAC.1
MAHVLHITTLVVDNVRPWCSSRFANRAGAMNHVRSAFKRGHCVVDAKIAPSSQEDKCDIVCQLCGDSFGSHSMYNMHIRSHIQAPDLLLEGRSDGPEGADRRG